MPPLCSPVPASITDDHLPLRLLSTPACLSMPSSGQPSHSKAGRVSPDLEERQAHSSCSANMYPASTAGNQSQHSSRGGRGAPLSRIHVQPRPQFPDSCPEGILEINSSKWSSPHGEFRKPGGQKRHCSEKLVASLSEPGSLTRAGPRPCLASLCRDTPETHEEDRARPSHPITTSREQLGAVGAIPAPLTAPDRSVPQFPHL